MVASGHLTLAMRAIYHGGICTTDSSVLLVTIYYVHKTVLRYIYKGDTKLS